MVYSIVKVINGNYFIHAEGITDLANAKSQFHALCQSLWNSSDVHTACVAIIDEDLEFVDNFIGVYKESITHDDASAS